MRRTIILILLVLAPVLLFAQGAYISDGLWHYLKNPKNENSPVRVVLVLRDHVDLQTLQNDFDKYNTPLDTRRHQVIRLLQQKAATSQQDIISYLDEYEKKHAGTINNFTSYWIANIITVEVPANLVWNLAERTDLEYIDLENAVKVCPIKPVNERPSDKLSVGGAEPGLKAIKADDMWRMGYTGKNRISYSIDTGVWPDHPALKDRFLANFFPLSQCWFPYDLEFPGDKTGSHGTHTLGITLGLDVATHDTIGCAFNAYWICSDPIVTNLADVKTLPVILHAFEWAFDPDGDTSTVWDIPDAINNSWGREPDTDTVLCDSYASQAFLAVEAAGIANVFAAGNDGPGPMTIGSPHNINSNIVNLFAVGALDGNQATYPIAGFSGRGPSICGGSGSLLIKPEVSAPGVNVRSSVNQNGYTNYDGTSMASPHVTGSVLLLKEAFPYLPGSEILKALYFTATDLGDPGEDNTYGMGLINLTSAFNYLSSLYTPVPPDSNTYDAEITNFSAPVNSYFCDSTLSPVIALHNNGDSIISTGTFRYKMLDGSEQVYPWAGNLAAGQTQNIALPAIPILSGGRKEFSVWFESDTAMHETSVINNHRMARFNFRPEVSLPFIEDFESGLNLERWCINNPDQNATWDTAAAGGLLFSTYSLMMQFKSTLLSGQTDEFVTPSFDFSGPDSVKLSFDVAYQNRHPALTDSLRIFVSTDCGQTFPYRVYHKGGANLQTYDTVTTNFVPWRADQWRKEYIDLTAFAGNSNVLIKFVGYNKKGNNLFIDNIKIYSGAEPAGISESDDQSWSVYPNPANSFLFLRYNGKSDDKCLIRIFSTDGRQMIQKILFLSNRTSYALDISKLRPGVYILHIDNDGAVFNQKIVKTGEK